MTVYMTSLQGTDSVLSDTDPDTVILSVCRSGFLQVRLSVDPPSWIMDLGQIK